VMRNPEHVLHTRAVVPLPLEEVFAFFCDAGNLQRITPPELGFEIRTPQPIDMGEGTRIEYRLSLLGLGFPWHTLITEWSPPHGFTDVQLRGPYAQWIHRHTFKQTDGGTLMQDEVRYRLPVPLLGLVGYPLVRLQLARIFGYRQRRIAELLSGAGSRQ
jgi:ligand-binding SRPBCC domain-containing protein